MKHVYLLHETRFPQGEYGDGLIDLKGVFASKESAQAFLDAAIAAEAKRRSVLHGYPVSPDEVQLDWHIDEYQVDP